VLAEFQDDGTKVTLGEQRLPVSSGAGGVDPHWRKDGKEIVYTAPSGQLMSVSVDLAGKSVTLGRPTPLPINPADLGGSGDNWAVNSTHTLFCDSRGATGEPADVSGGSGEVRRPPHPSDSRNFLG
jgi:hypothetical protein